MKRIYTSTMILMLMISALCQVTAEDYTGRVVKLDEAAIKAFNANMHEGVNSADGAAQVEITSYEFPSKETETALYARAL